MSKTDIFLKRAFDICFAAVGVVVFAPLIVVCWVIAAIETRGNGFFVHPRVGRHGEIFRVIKIKTMHAGDARRSHIAAHNAAVITRSGAMFRKYKLDELPQLFNVLAGSMSFVGPRPDVPNYADQLQGNDRIILQMRPGITGPASIKYRNEEYLLAIADDPLVYNDSVIWPDKVRINKEYFLNYSLLADIKYIAQTLFR